MIIESMARGGGGGGKKGGKKNGAGLTSFTHPSGEPPKSLRRLLLPLHEQHLSIITNGVESNNDAVHARDDAVVNVLRIEAIGKVRVVPLNFRQSLLVRAVIH